MMSIEDGNRTAQVNHRRNEASGNEIPAFVIRSRMRGPVADLCRQ
jgi:hypothetical protein